MFNAIIIGVVVFFTSVSVQSDTVLADPTVPPQVNATNSGHAGFRLDAIMIQGEKSIVIINGKKMMEGDYVDDVRLVTIEGARIEIERRKTRQWVNLFENVAIKPVEKKSVDIEVIVQKKIDDVTPMEVVQVQELKRNVNE